MLVAAIVKEESLKQRTSISPTIYCHRRLSTSREDGRAIMLHLPLIDFLDCPEWTKHTKGFRSVYIIIHMRGKLKKPPHRKICKIALNMDRKNMNLKKTVLNSITLLIQIH